MITNLKKILISIFISTNIFNYGFALTEDKDINNVCIATKTPIEDELIQTPQFKAIAPVFLREKPVIEDELINNYHSSDNTNDKPMMLWARKEGTRVYNPIEDELITSTFKNIHKRTLALKKQKTIIEDTFAKNSIDLKNISLLKRKNIYDFTKERVPIELKVIKNISTKKEITEGNYITFKTIKDVTINGKILPKGTKVIGRVETVSESDKMGAPFNIVIDNFKVDEPKTEEDAITFYGSITKNGANRTIWVYPIYQAGNLILYVAGFAVVPIHGGHAKLLTSETYTVFYETR